MSTPAHPLFAAQPEGRDRTLADGVYERILSGIVEDEFGVGSRLPTETKLADRFGVSRPVVRQALKQLREDDVIVSRQGSGSYVKRRPDAAVLQFAPVGSIADIQRTFEFRAVLESEAAALAAVRRSDVELAQIARALAELDRCVAAGELGTEADEAFHMAVCAAADNHYFEFTRASMRNQITTGIAVNRSLSLTSTEDRMAIVQKEHQDIYDAIAARDAAGARRAMFVHVDGARRRVFAGLSAKP